MFHEGVHVDGIVSIARMATLLVGRTESKPDHTFGSYVNVGSSVGIISKVRKLVTTLKLERVMR